MSAILMALLSYIGWGTGDIFGALAARKIGGVNTAFWIMVGAAILFTPLAIFDFHTLTITPLPTIITAILIGFLFQSGNFAVSQALAVSDVSIVLTIMGSFGAFIVLFSTLFLHEPITVIQIVILLVIYTGIFLCTYRPGAHVDKDHQRGIWYALYSAISFGIFFTVIKQFGSTLGWFWPLYLSFFWLPIFYIIFQRLHIRVRIRDFVIARTPIIFALLLIRGGDLIFNIGLQQGLSAIVAPIGSASPTLSVILAFLVFHEKPTKRQAIGIVLALAGIVALAWVSNV